MSSSTAKTVVFLLGVFVLVTGCGTTDPAMPFREVQADVQARTGTEIHWQRSLEAKEHLSHRIQSLLQDGLTLEEAVAIGLANNRRIQGIYQELGVAQAALAQSRLVDNPHVGFAYLGGASDVYKLELEVVFNILNLFLMPLREALATEQLIHVQQSVAAAVLSQIFRIQRAYLTAQALQQEYRLLERILLSSEAAFQMAERMRDAGNITQLELLSRRSLMDEDRLALSSASLAILDCREHLNRLMGLWGMDVNWTLPGDLPPLPQEEPDFSDVEKRAVEASIDLAVAKSELRVAARELGITNVTSIIPDLGIGAAFEREEDGMWLGGPALALEIPIFDQGYPKRSRARALLESHWERFTALAVEVRSQARQALQHLRVAREQVLFYQRSFLPLRKAITEQAQRRYNGMYLGVFELLMIKRMEIRASLAYVAAMKTYWFARVDMDTILAGKLPGNPNAVRIDLPVSDGITLTGDHS